MKTTKMALIFILFLALPVMAFYEPVPVVVQVATYDAEPIFVKATNINTTNGYSVNGYTASGELILDGLAGHTVKGDVIKVEVLGISKQTTYAGSPMIFQFDFKTGVTPPTITLEGLIAIIIGFLAVLGISIRITKKKYSSGDKTVAQVEVNLSEGGVKTHRHKNIVGFHSPYTMHKYQPHKKGELQPKYNYVANSQGKYDYLG